MRKYLYISILTLISLVATAANADDIYFAKNSNFDAGNELVINGGSYLQANADSGWFRSDGNHFAGNQSYLTGSCDSCGPYQYRGYFAFGQLESGVFGDAQFTVNTYSITGKGSLELFGTDLDPYQVDSSQNWTDISKYNALNSGVLLGEISLDPSLSNQYVTVDFSSAGLAWLNSHAGDDIVIGANWDAVATPEPGTLMLLGSGMTGLTGVIRRRRS